MTLSAVLDRIDADLPQALDRLFDLLRIDSVSTDPAHAASCRTAADWLVAELSGMGFEASRRDTPGHPMVVAHGGGEGPHLLFYGHYDVQPADPLELWETPPFEPVLRDTPEGKVISARGACDDKGQLMTFVEALRAWIAVEGSVPTRITFLFEGEEESGSPSLVPFLEANAEELRADLALVCDTGMWDRKTPAISTMLRGLAAEQVTIQAASRDLHSGMYGGPAMNPIRVLTRILGQLHDETGRVTLPGFYEGVAELSPEMKAQWESLAFDAEGFLGAVGLSVPAGEEGYSALEQIWARPTCDINGIWGGYTGEGFKTVLPAEAHAKVSFRLVGDQDPEKILESFRAFVAENLPADCSARFAMKEPSRATVLPVEAPEFARARAALSEEWPKPAVFAGCGGSIPIVGHFKEILGMDSLLIGFGQEDDAIHSPNEKYDLASFHKGMRSWARVLDALTSKA
ncbi:dipeptidase [Rhodobacteraceae bacterium DSL-40]|uniref:dipeptidase n=1 Tax=Amaricoccus sp. B4 TaxID=3368557 RepID=UPI000DAE5E40